MKYSIESLLRPIVEYSSAFLALLCAYCCYLFQGYFLLPDSISVGLICFFLGYGCWRLSQARRVRRYQRRLTVLPRFSLKLSKIPYSKHKLYLGKGFVWRAKHTQRLRDCLLPQHEKYLRDSRVSLFLERLAVTTERSRLWSPVSRFILWDSPFNPVRPKPPVGGRGELHGVGMLEGEHDVFEDRSERVGHTLVLGTTRVGKTRLAEELITQDIRNGETVFVFDPKGDADLLRSMYTAASLAGRLDNFYTFHLAYPNVSARYNPIGNYTRITEVATRIANALPGSGNSAAFKEFGWRFTNIIAQALHFLGLAVSYESIGRYIEDTDQLIVKYGESWLESVIPGQWQDDVAKEKYGLTGSKDDRNKPYVDAKSNTERSRDIDAVCMARVLSRYLRESNSSNPVAEGLLSAFKFEKAYFDKIVASLGPFLAKLTTGAVSQLLSPNYDDLDDDRPTFNPSSIIRTNGIVYVGLAALQDATVASAVGNAMFADITSTAGQLYAYGSKVHASIKDAGYAKVSIHADEFNELIGDEFIPLLNKAGGAGIQVTAYTQTWSDVEARLGDKAKAEQVGGNLNTLIMMRILKAETAEILTDRLPDVQINRVTTVSAATQSSNPLSPTDFTARAEDRLTSEDVPMLEPSDLTRLPKGQAFVLSQGGKLTKVRLPLSANDPSVKIPNSIEDLTKKMRVDMKVLYQDTWRRDAWWETHVQGTLNSISRRAA